VRTALYGTAVLALAMLFSPEFSRCALATSASALFEATPFVLAGIVAARVLRLPHAGAFLGCGCAAGPSARSLPAAAATWLVFGPTVAATRFAAASLVAATMHRNRKPSGCASRSSSLIEELTALLAPALVAGMCMQLAAAFDLGRLAPPVSAAGGALLAFATAPCGIGAVAVAAALRARAPHAAAAFLCVAGIVDLRAITRRPHAAAGHDALAYLLLSAALATAALRRGDALVHPAMAPILGACAVAATIGALLNRRQQAPAQRYAPAVMLVGALVGAPPPQYHATQTTLRDLFPGEQLSFTGTLTRDRTTSALVRYAITCCRADATPVVVRLEVAPPYAAGSWLHADGSIEKRSGDLRLVARHVERVAAPYDPFIYR
jgi:hypothetical protein